MQCCSGDAACRLINPMLLSLLCFVFVWNLLHFLSNGRAALLMAEEAGPEHLRLTAYPGWTLILRPLFMRDWMVLLMWLRL